MNAFFIIFAFLFTATLTSGLSLSEYLRQVEQNNLEIKTESSKLAAAEARSAGLNIPSPMLGLTQMKIAGTETTSGLEISQNLPFPSKISTEHEIRKLEAKGAGEQYLANKISILSEARKAYVNLWKKRQERKILEEKKHFLEEHVKITQSQVRSDSSMKLHLLKSESDLDDLLSEALLLDENVNTAQITMNVFLNQVPNANVEELQDPPRESLPVLSENYSNHLLRSLDYEFKINQKKESLAAQTWLPDFNLRYKETGASSMTPKSTEIMVAIDLPFLFFWKPNAEAKTAAAERMRSEVELIKKRTSLQGDRAELYARAVRIRKQLELIETKLIPRATQREKLVHHISPRDMESLQDHRETLDAGPELKLKRINLISEYENLIADLQKLTQQAEVQHE